MWTPTTRLLIVAQLSGVALRQEEDTEQDSRDVERLETALSERARELVELKAELDRRRVLIRDLTARWERAPVGAAAAGVDATELEQVRRQRDAAVGRAIDAEAACLDARLRIDELTGHLAVATPHPEAQAAQLAAHEGALRGMRSRLAEAEDARDRAQARLMLTEHDLDDSRTEMDRLRRQQLELGERLEIEALRSRTAEVGLTRLRSELLGTRHRADASERSVQSLIETSMSNKALGEHLRSRVSLSLAERDAARGALAVVKAERDAATAEIAELRGDVATLRDELAEREADLASARAGHGDTGELRERATSLQEALLDARQGLRELSAWLSGEGVPAAWASTTSFELEAPLGVSSLPPREDETLPGVPLHVQAIAAVETMAVEALEDQLARKDEQLRALEARIDELLRRQGAF